MKLVIAIINSGDSSAVVRHLSMKGFSCTKMASTGGFLMSGNVTLLVGVNDENVQTVIDVVGKHSKSRKQMIPTTTEMGFGNHTATPVEINVGGATIFVVDVERFEKL